jgi:hypothetical protein
MQRQIGFAEAESAGKKRVTKRQRFLAEMEKVVRGRGCCRSSSRITRRVSEAGRRLAWNGC